MLRTSAFLFPTTTVLVDDDNLYAQLLVDRLTDSPPIKVLSDFDLLLAQKDKDFIYLNFQDAKETNDDINTLIELSVKQKINRLNNVISVMIFDLHMTHMTGLEAFYQLKSPFIYKILISNFIDSQFKDEIKEAQNLGIIDVVLDKGSALRNELPKAVFAGQSRFFTKLSSQFFEKREAQNYLSDPAFSAWFQKAVEDFQPHFIWPERDLSSFTFERQEGNRTKKIFVSTQNEIEILLNGYNAESASVKTIEQLKSGDFIVCHSNPHGLEGSDWPYYMRKARKIIGANDTFFYGIIDESGF